MFYGICTLLGIWTGKTGAKNNASKYKALGADD